MTNATSKRRNPNRGIVLRLDDAANIHRMLEFWFDDRRFDNPIVAMEIRREAEAAKDRLGDKLIAIFAAHSELVAEAQDVEVPTA